MTDRTYLLHLKDENQLFKLSEFIQEAKRQEADEIKPHYTFYNYKKGEHITPPGWLVYSTYRDGCGVVYKVKDSKGDDKYILITGWQGDFVYN